MKAYTNIEQSRKLAEILSIESLDMFWLVSGNTPRVHVLTEPLSNYSRWESYPCWSLAALLNVLPKIVNNETLFIETSAALWHIGYRNIYTARADNPVDACYKLVLKLHELKLL